MPDVFTPAKRSHVMSRIRGRGNKDTELALAALLRRNGIAGWRRHQPVFGKPDFVFPKLRLAIFVDGCFWHCCPGHSNLPVNNRASGRPNSRGTKSATIWSSAHFAPKVGVCFGCGNTSLHLDRSEERRVGKVC